MEFVRDTELKIVGERYASFAEAYGVNERRLLNEKCSPRGDGAARGLFEADDGVMFTPEDTKQALLYGTDMFDERFKRATRQAAEVLGEHYEWMSAPAADTDVQGQHVIVERFAAGHPEAFRRKRPQMRQMRSVNILYDAMCSASTSTKARIEAGCCILAAAQALEKLGYEVALTFLLAKYSGQPGSSDPTLVFEVMLKNYGEPLSSKRMQFALAAKPVLFHLGCWWAHRCPSTPIDYGAGEGYPVSYDKVRVKSLEAHAEKLHGVYLSEDIVELKLRMDPVKVLERILGDLDAGEDLVAHMKAKTPIAVAAQPEQGKMFGGWKTGGREEPAQVITPRDQQQAGGGVPGEALSPVSATRSEGQAAGGENVRRQQPPDASGQAENSAAPSSGPSALAGAGMQRDWPSSSARKVPDAPGHSGSSAGERVSRSDALGDELQDSMQHQLCENVSGARREPAANTGSGESDSESEAGGKAPPEGSGAADEDSRHDGPHDGDVASRGGEREGDASGGPGEQEDEAAAAPEAADGGEEDENMDDEEVLGISKDEERDDQTQAPDAQDEDADTMQDDFIVKLRKRFVRFENGEYLRYMAEEKAARQKANEAARAAVASGVPTPPAPTPAERMQAPMGAPRNTPLSMNYL